MYLPSAPSDKQKYTYLGQKRLVFYSFCILSSVLLFSGMFLFSFVNPLFTIYSLFVLVLLIYLFVSYMVGVKGKPFDFKEHQRIVSTYTDRSSTVDIYLPICGESFDVVANTWKHVKELDWPSHLLNVYVLDDGWSDKAQELAANMGFHYIRRDNRPYLKKAGNIRNAFGQTSGDFIVILDADFCPRPDFVSELMPYMIRDNKIAIMQSPQFFEVSPKQTWIEQSAASVQELFYRLIQVSRNTWGASICVGSCAMYRRAALEPQGGTYPIEHSEDLHTGFSMLKVGLKVKYIPVNLAMGVCPDTLPAFFIQQYRWCTGSTSLMTNSIFWKHNLNFMARLSFLSGMLYYFATSSAIFLSVVPSMIIVWFFPEKLIWFTLIFYLPSFLFSVLFMKWWNITPYSLNVQKIRQVSYWAFFFALKDKFMKTTVPWIPTGATSNVGRYYTFRKWLFWWGTISFTVVLSGVVRNMDGLTDFNFYPTLFFCLFNYWVNITILRDQ